MASLNGVLSPPTQRDSDNHHLSLSAKRKREDSIGAQTLLNGSSNSRTRTADEHERDTSLIQDLLDVLKSHDPTPSILTRTLPDRTISTEPQAKRFKTDGGADLSTILARAASNAYSNLDDVLQDIDAAVDDIVSKLELPNSTTRQYRPVSAEENEVSLRITAFQKRARDLVQKEKPSKPKHERVNGSAILPPGATNSTHHVKINTNSGNEKTVLTLFGNAPHGKQLFSSFQVPNEISGEIQGVIPALREAGLPPGISTTQIVSNKSTGLAGDKKPAVQTLGTLFPTPASVPTITPPKPSKVGTTRSSTVGWYQPAAPEVPSRSVSYFGQHISTGQWIDYSNVATAQSNKRKQRDRAMSLTGSRVQLEVESAESEAAKLESLFRGAYSSFAPTKDNSAAIVPDGTLEKMWWQRIGEKSYERFIDNVNKFEDVVAVEQDPKESSDEDIVPEDFDEAVKWYEEHALDPALTAEASTEKSAMEKDVEEILGEISELLETLNSYQRIRNLSLKPAGSGILSTTDTPSVGTPSKPSEAERATYEVLKSQLALMIASLPPFAVAKLKPDQLADLGISTKIPVEMENYNGVMEEDEAGTRAKALLNTGSSSRVSQSSSLQRTNSTPAYGNQYAAGRPQTVSTQQYYGSQTPVRPPVMQRPSGNAAVPYQIQGQRPASNAPFRPSNYGTGTGTPSYAHQAPRPVQQAYGTATTPYANATQGYARPVGQSYQNTPQFPQQAASGARYPNQPSYPQQTPSQNSNYQYNGNSNNTNNNTPAYNSAANTGRQASPQKPLAYSPQPMSARPAYPVSTPTPPILPNNRQQYLQAPPMAQGATVNGGSQSPQPQPQPSQQSTGYSTFMTTDEQASMMDRQRAQLAAQQLGTQQQARQIAQAAQSTSQVNGSAVAAGL